MTASMTTLACATQIACAWLGNNAMNQDLVPAFFQAVHDKVVEIETGKAAPVPRAQLPFVSIKKSVTPGYLVCLEDGKRMKMLKRYLRTQYNMTPEQYRTKWGLPHDYPMVAADYAERRSVFAKKIGLGKSKSRAK